jgi:hypothetical protein
MTCGCVRLQKVGMLVRDKSVLSIFCFFSATSVKRSDPLFVVCNTNQCVRAASAGRKF